MNKQYGIVENAEPLSVIKCDGCDKDVPCFSQNKLPEHGLSLRLATMDYYGGFSDFIEGDPPEFLLCHDCSLTLLTSLPRIASKLPKGLHPCELEKPCCDYAWKWTDDDGQWKNKTLYFAENGEWVVAPQ